MIGEFPKPVFWIDSNSAPPVCDVPWVGRAIVEPTGKVKFCCFTPHTVGDINTSSFEEIWNGDDLRRIRQELADQRLPRECQTNACPIYRGDKLNYIVRRLDDQRETNEFAELVRRNLGGSLRIDVNEASGRNAIDIDLDLAHENISCHADLVVGVRLPDGTQAFLPDFEPYPMPLYPGLPIAGESPIRLNLVTGETQHFSQAGVYEVCAALFDANSDLNFLSNYFWSDTAIFTLQAVQPSAACTANAR